MPLQRLSRRAKRRTRTRNKMVLRGPELCQHFQVSEDALLDFLRLRGIDFHKDSNQEIWASVIIDPITTATP